MLWGLGDLITKMCKLYKFEIGDSWVANMAVKTIQMLKLMERLNRWIGECFKDRLVCFNSLGTKLGRVIFEGQN